MTRIRARPAGRHRAASPTPAPRLRSEAWLLLGLFSSIPGELILGNGALCFVAHGAGSAWPSQLRTLERRLRTPGLAVSIERGQPTRCFRWRVDAVEAWVPRHYFGGGMRVRHEEAVVSFGFACPANMESRLGAFGEVRKQFRAVRRMRARCREWMAALSPAIARRDATSCGQPDR